MHPGVDEDPAPSCLFTEKEIRGEGPVEEGAFSHIKGDDSAQQTSVHSPFRESSGSAEPPHQADRQDRAPLFGSSHHLVALCHGERQRLFH
jgi:hypothetical protein